MDILELKKLEENADGEIRISIDNLIRNAPLFVRDGYLFAGDIGGTSYGIDFTEEDTQLLKEFLKAQEKQ